MAVQTGAEGAGRSLGQILVAWLMGELGQGGQQNNDAVVAELQKLGLNAYQVASILGMAQQMANEQDLDQVATSIDKMDLGLLPTKAPKTVDEYAKEGGQATAGTGAAQTGGATTGQAGTPPSRDVIKEPTPGNNDDAYAGQLEDYPERYYRRAIGMPALGGTDFQRFQERQFDPMYAGFNIRSGMTPGAPETFADYYGKLPSSTGYRQANAQTFADLLGQGIEGRTKSLYDIDPGELNAFLGSTLYSKYAAPAAQRFGKAIPQLKEHYLASNPTGGTESFLDYFNRYFGGR